MQAGDTFRLEGVADRHLWVVLSDPELDTKTVVIVSLTSYDVTKEDVCIIEAGEHPAVTHKTCVAYDKTRDASLAALISLCSSGRLIPDVPVTSDLLKRIRQGVSLSRDIPVKYIDFLLDQAVIE